MYDAKKIYLYAVYKEIERLLCCQTSSLCYVVNVSYPALQYLILSMPSIQSSPEVKL